MLSKEWIKHKAHEVVYKAGTNNPILICERNHIPVCHQNLGRAILGHYTNVSRIPLITLSAQNDEFEDNYACAHELGHHYCQHGNNTEWLSRNNLRFNTFGSEYEANKFMVDMMLDGVNAHDFETREQLMRYCHIPSWADRYIDWDLLIE